uniref:Scavenger receptor class F member 1 n=1 Tax=Varanus komodoensis TaxID=61221 RepID=A0A8D2J310_VARKO
MAAWSRELPCSATREGMPRATGAASSGGGVWRARGLLLTIRFSPASQPPVFTCCSGWKQEGRESLCEGDEACRGDEVCVRPGVCRCRPGFFGAGCATRCPGQFWGPDCKESCHCHPDGTCDPAGGTCSCHPGRWGPLCQFACACGPRGHCDPLSGACRCRPGWWGPECRRQCLCDQAGSRCDPGTGRCLCHRGRWGRRCSFACSCNGSPCAQQSGRCECRSGLWGAACQNPCQCRHGTCAPQDGRCACDAGYRGPSCSEPCPAGSFGPRCKSRCGHCKDPSSCSPVNGSCPECEPGWMGADCQRLCPPGRHGENCSQPCPRCFRGEPCHPETGACQSCEPPALTPALPHRCEDPCPAGLFGAGCQFRCPDCANGSCDPASGACVCQAGFWGASCNRTCPAGLHGPNCSAPCQCPGGACHPASGACQGGSARGSRLLLGPGTPGAPRTRPGETPVLSCPVRFLCRAAAVAEGDPLARAKRHVLGTLADLRAASPCFSLGSYRVPGVTGEEGVGAWAASPALCLLPSNPRGAQTGTPPASCGSRPAWSPFLCFLPLWRWLSSLPPRHRDALQPQLHRAPLGRLALRQLLRHR